MANRATSSRKKRRARRRTQNESLVEDHQELELAKEQPEPVHQAIYNATKEASTSSIVERGSETNPVKIICTKYKCSSAHTKAKTADCHVYHHDRDMKVKENHSFLLKALSAPAEGSATQIRTYSSQLKPEAPKVVSKYFNPPVIIPVAFPRASRPGVTSLTVEIPESNAPTHDPYNYTWKPSYRRRQASFVTEVDWTRELEELRQHTKRKACKTISESHRYENSGIKYQLSDNFVHPNLQDKNPGQITAQDDIYAKKKIQLRKSKSHFAGKARASTEPESDEEEFYSQIYEVNQITRNKNKSNAKDEISYSNLPANWAQTAPIIVNKVEIEQTSPTLFKRTQRILPRRLNESPSGPAQNYNLRNRSQRIWSTGNGLLSNGPLNANSPPDVESSRLALSPPRVNNAAPFIGPQLPPPGSLAHLVIHSEPDNKYSSRQSNTTVPVQQQIGLLNQYTGASQRPPQAQAQAQAQAQGSQQNSGTSENEAPLKELPKNSANNNDPNNKHSGHDGPSRDNISETSSIEENAAPRKLDSNSQLPYCLTHFSFICHCVPESSRLNPYVGIHQYSYLLGRAYNDRYQLQKQSSERAKDHSKTIDQLQYRIDNFEDEVGIEDARDIEPFWAAITERMAKERQHFKDEEEKRAEKEKWLVQARGVLTDWRKN